MPTALGFAACYQRDARTLSGLRKWQSRQVVTIDGQEQYTDWEDIPQMNGTFTGTWSLVWERNDKGVGENHLCRYVCYRVHTV